MIYYPRLNYKYTLTDLFYSIKGVFKKNMKPLVWNDQFEGKEFFYYNHARTALRVLLTSLGLNKNQGVGLAAFNCLTVMNSIDSANLNPIFIDINNDFSLDLDDLERKKDKIAVLIVNHMFGIPNHSIFEIRKRFPDLLIIEDCAHAFLSEINSKQCGTIGDFSVFSFGMAKFPSIADGGFLVVNNEKYLESISANTDLLKKVSLKGELIHISKRFLLGLFSNPFIYFLVKNNRVNSLDSKHDYTGKYSQHESLNYKSSMYLLNRKKKKFANLLSVQKRNGITLKKTIPNEMIMYNDDYNYFMLPILYHNRDKLIRNFKTNGVELGTHFSKSIVWAQNFNYKLGDCKKAEYIAKNIVTIPTHYNMKEKHVKRCKILLNDLLIKI